MRTRQWRAFALVLTVIAGCGGDSGDDTDVDVGAPDSIVVLGDSVAAGEGIDHGYIDSTSIPNHWTGGVDNPTWEGMYQLCHQSVMAYGDLVSASLGGELAKFACTGHEGCSSDPWAYGLSILILHDDSQAPFHLTPDGQAAVARVVEQTLASAD